MPSVLQPWVEVLSFMQQSVLMTAVRGPDGLHKNHPSKAALRWYRRCVFYAAFERKILEDPHEPGGGSFTGPCPYTSLKYVRENYFNSLDEVPLHFHMHLVHAAEIVGYKHPNRDIKLWWNSFYLQGVMNLHLSPESESSMDFRLSDSFENWVRSEDIDLGIAGNPLEEEEDL